MKDGSVESDASLRHLQARVISDRRILEPISSMSIQRLTGLHKHISIDNSQSCFSRESEIKVSFANYHRSPATLSILHTH